MAGGINTNNIRQAVESVHPYAIDIESGANRSLPTVKEKVKSVLKVQKIMESLKGINQS